MKGRQVVFLAALAGLLACAGCQKTPPGPLPRSITPASALPASAISVVVRGEHFNPLVSANFDDESSRVDATFTVRLGQSVVLGSVVLSAPGALDAIVPAGLPPGLYDVVVIDPAGRSGRLADAFTVLGGPPPDAGDGGQSDGRTNVDALGDGPIIDLPRPDLPPKEDLGPCSPACSSCSGATCIVQCSGSDCTCPPGVSDCRLVCSGGAECVGTISCGVAKKCSVRCSAKSCQGTIDCAASICDVTCTSSDTCKKITCGPAGCVINCLGKESCEGSINCNGACKCAVNCVGPESCQGPVSCLPGCKKSGKGCKACDTCP